MNRFFLFSLSLVLFISTASAQVPVSSSFVEKTFVKDEQIRPHLQVQKALRLSPAWQQFSQAHGDWWVQFDERTSIPLFATGRPIRLAAGDPVEAVRKFMNTELSGFGLPVNEMVFKNIRKNGKFTVIRFEQVHEGKKVLWSDVKFQLDDSGRLIFFKLRAYPIKNTIATAGLPESAVKDLALNGLEEFEIQSVALDPSEYLLPVIASSGEYEYRIVKEAKVSAMDANTTPSRFRTLIDMSNGQILYRSDEIHSCAPAAADLVIRDSTVANPIDGGAPENMPNMMVLVGSDTLYTDSEGQLLLPDLQQATEIKIFLEGKYARVVNAATDSVTILIDTVYPGTNTLNLSGAKLTEINGYYQTDRVHDHMKNQLPSDFTTLDIPMTVNVDISTGSCNAFFNGSSINFFLAGGGCPATALFGDVIYHEYGHGINYFYYDYLGGNFSNGALGEGYSDIWGFSITKDPILGKGFLGDPNSNVRRYDIDRKVYPEDIIGEVHADGEIIAGAFWDLYLNLGDMQKMTDLFIGGHNGTPDAPDGMEGPLFSEILLEVLLTDDDDGDLSNGTPNDSSILDAFGKHGISLLAGVEITHDAPLTSNDTTGIVLTANVNTTLTSFIGDVTLHYRKIGETAWNSMVMEDKGATFYSVELPGMQNGDIIEYYFGIADIFAQPAAVEPIKADLTGDANLPYFLLIGYSELAREDFDNDFGPWFFDPDGDDDAETGRWTIESPNPSFSGSFMVQTGTDKTEIGNDLNLCAFTGNASVSASYGTNDVDAGKTTLQTPPFDLSDIENPAISYWRWFVNDPPGGANPGNDAWQVFISNDGINWIRVERTFVSDVSWRQNVVRVEDYVEKSDKVSLRFVAQDSLIPGLQFDGGSIVEAAVDELQVFGLGRTNTGLESSPLAQIAVFPVPADDLLLIQLANQEVDKVMIFDISGKRVMDLPGLKSGQLKIDVRSLPQGMYFLQLSNAEDAVSKKILIRH